ncbi:beta-1,6-N-acetylglucosaminyltransferase [Puia dinghuensis]|uniref:Peptide O-xylosyltransferase n=1 Tax=Puia dinghuensis TaxID=1792502 RepID=A0A8J2UH84_9BACT|nr:beta-1,6-N-acetylglucosaminyltransferase [Puia dinghuensis]GGB16538.1 glycosyl transferase [Puia dinghuensis]
MRIAHLILTHKNPQQLARLISVLDHPAFDFYIHVDKKVDQAPFDFLAQKKNVFFINNRVRIYWAGYGTIQATLNGFEEILPKKYDYINVTSGQDFPLQSPDHIYRYIADRKGLEFITCESIEDEWKDAAPRVYKYHLINWRIPGKHRLEILTNKMLAKKLLPSRKFPLDYKIVGRSNWFTLTSPAVQYVFDFLKQHPKVVRYFKFCWGADEFIFASVLYNSPFKDCIRDSLVYVDWTGKSDGHPRILEVRDFEKMKASGKLFGRKFDADTDPRILDMLEESIQKANLIT